MSRTVLASVVVTLSACAAAAPASITVVHPTVVDPAPAAPDFTFNGIDQEYAVDDPTLPTGAAPRTLAAWFRTSATEGAHVIANWGTPEVGRRFGLLVDAGRVKLVGEFQDIMSTQTFADGKWHHAAATFDGSYAVVYVDGRPQVGGQLQLDTQGDRFVIGNAPRAHAPEWWHGDIDAVSIYPRALPAPEVARLAGL